MEKISNIQRKALHKLEYAKWVENHRKILENTRKNNARKIAYYKRKLSVEKWQVKKEIMEEKNEKNNNRNKN